MRVEEDKMKKWIALLLTAMMLFSLAACGSSGDGASDSGKYTIGIVQLVQHEAQSAGNKHGAQQ